MAKKKHQEGGVPVTKKPSIEQKWNDYFKKGDIEDWRRLCADLGLPDDLPSKRQCRIVSLLSLHPLSNNQIANVKFTHSRLSSQSMSISNSS